MTDKRSAKKRISCSGGRKAVFLIFALLLVVALVATALVACKPDGPKGQTDAELRAAAVDGFVDGAIAAAGEGWKTEMTNPEIAALARPSSYIVSSAWIKRTGELLSASSVSTAKIQALAEYVATDEAKALLRSESFDFEKFVSAFSEIGFTSADTQEIVFALLVELADGQAIFTAVKDTLGAVYQYASGSKLNDIKTTQTAVEALLGAYESNNGLRASIEAAENGICSIVDMAYQGMYMFGSGETGDGLYAIIEAMNAGALSDISKADAYTYLTSFLSQAAAMRDKFTAEEVSLLSDTLGKLDDAFGGLTLPSSLRIGGMLGYFGEMKFAADWMYYALDTVYNAGSALLNEKDGQGALTYRFIDRLFGYAEAADGLKDETAKEYNSYILYAELLLAAEKEGAFGDKLAAQLAQYASETDMDNLINLFACSALFDIWVYEEKFDSVEDIIGEQQYRSICITVAGLNLNAFKNSYAKFLMNSTTGKLRVKLKNLLNYMDRVCAEFGLNNPFGDDKDLPADITPAWYNSVVAGAEEIINAAANQITSEDVSNKIAATEHIKEAIIKFLGTPKVRSALESLASAEFATADMSSAELADWESAIKECLYAFLPLWYDSFEQGQIA